MLLVASERSTGTVAPPPPPWRASRRPRHSLTSAAKEVDFFFGFTSRRVETRDGFGLLLGRGWLGRREPNRAATRRRSSIQASKRRSGAVSSSRASNSRGTDPCRRPRVQACGSRPAAAARAAAACCRVRRLNRATVRSKKAIVTKKEAAKGDTGSHGAGVDEHKMPGGVRKISNGTVSGRGVGAMSYDPQVRSVCIPPHHHHHRLPHTVPLCDGTQRRWRSTDVFALSNPRARRQTWTSVSSKRATASACTHDASPGNASRTHRSWYMATGWRNHGALRLPVARNRSHLSGGL